MGHVLMGFRGFASGPVLSFPSALTTGPAAGGYTSLTPVTIAANTVINTSNYGSYGIAFDGTSYSMTAVDMSCGTYVVTLELPNFTMTGCKVTGWGTSQGGLAPGTGYAATKASYCEIAGLSVNERMPSGLVNFYEADHCNIYWCRTALWSSVSGVAYTSNYVHDMGWLPSGTDHVDPVYFYGNQSDITVSGNTLLNNLTTAQGASGCWFLDVNGGGSSSIPVSGNLMAGGASTVYCGVKSGYSPSGLVVSGNYFTTAYYLNCGVYGVISEPPAWGSNGNEWSGNYWYDGPSQGQLVPS